MAQEFTIKSQSIEDKINQLLPSQGGFEPGVDFSASTMVIPIVDLTETAEGGSVRQDLQTAVSFSSATTFDVNNTTTTIVNTTGYWRMTAVSSCGGSPTQRNSIILNDGTTDKTVWKHVMNGTGNSALQIDLIFFLKAGDSIKLTADSSSCRISGSIRQIADISGNLVDP